MAFDFVLSKAGQTNNGIYANTFILQFLGNSKRGKFS